MLISHQQQNAEQTQILAARSTSGILGVLRFRYRQRLWWMDGHDTATITNEDEAELDFMALVVNDK